MKMPFEMTEEAIRALRKDYEGKHLIFEEYMDALAHEAQKELMKWQQEICVDSHHAGYPTGLFGLPKRACPNCQKDLLKHFGLDKEVR